MIIRINPTNRIIAERGLGKNKKVQKFVDSECIRRMAKYTPFRTGTLVHSATLGTVIGSGKIKQSTPYARHNYYYNGGNGLQGTASGGLRGRLWFERMKAANKQAILDGARRLAGTRRGN